MLVLEQASRGRSGGARSIRIISAAVAGAQEKFRLREPADRATEMRAVDGEDLKLLAGYAAHPAGHLAGLPIPGRRDRIAIVDQACLAFRNSLTGRAQPRSYSLSPSSGRGPEYSRE